MWGHMLIFVVIAGFAILIFQLWAQRVLLVELVRQLRILNLMVEQIDGVDASEAGGIAQAELDRAAGRRG